MAFNTKMFSKFIPSWATLEESQKSHMNTAQCFNRRFSKFQLNYAVIFKFKILMDQHITLLFFLSRLNPSFHCFGLIII